MNRYAHYTYQITNKASLVLLGVVVVTLGSLFIKALLRPGEEWVLRLAWSVWGIAVVIRVFEALLRRFALRQP
jgi:hypothetical protein